MKSGPFLAIFTLKQSVNEKIMKEVCKNEREDVKMIESLRETHTGEQQNSYSRGTVLESTENGHLLHSSSTIALEITANKRYHTEQVRESLRNSSIRGGR